MSGSLSTLSQSEFQDRINQRRASRMNKFDNMPPEMRELINAYGLGVVDAFIAHGVSKPKQIRHLVETVLDNFSPTRGCSSAQGSHLNRPDLL